MLGGDQLGEYTKTEKVKIKSLFSLYLSAFGKGENYIYDLMQNEMKAMGINEDSRRLLEETKRLREKVEREDK